MIDFDIEPPIDTFKNSQLYPASDKVISCLCRIKGNKQLYCVLSENVIFRSDIHKIQTGKFVYFGPKCVIKPPLNMKGDKMEMGSYIFIDTDSVIRSRLIGNYVYIGKNVVIGENSIIDSSCYIEDNTVIPPETRFPPNTYISGNPAQVTDYLPESFQLQIKYYIEKRYKSIIKNKN